MATAPVLAFEQLAAVPATWTDNPAVRTLFEAIRDLQPIHDKLACLRLTPRAFENDAATEIGSMTIRYSMGPRFGVGMTRKLSATGVSLTLWQHVEDIRDRWIAHSLAGEGLRPDLRATADRYHARYAEMQDEAVSVPGAWGAFERGTL